MIVIAPVAALGVALPVTAGLLRGNSIGLAGVLGMACALCGVTIAGAQSGAPPAAVRPNRHGTTASAGSWPRR
jgi:hypothetical protein